MYIKTLTIQGFKSCKSIEATYASDRPLCLHMMCLQTGTRHKSSHSRQDTTWWSEGMGQARVTSSLVSTSMLHASHVCQ